MLVLVILRRLLKDRRVAGSISWLRWSITRRCRPGHILEVEEFRHVHLRGISLSERSDVETRFNQFQNSRVIGFRM